MAEENLKLRVAISYLLCIQCCLHLVHIKKDNCMTIIQKDEMVNGLTNRGKIGIVKMDELTFGVIIKDARHRFGHLDYLIEPLNGTGTQWVENHRVEIKG